MLRLIKEHFRKRSIKEAAAARAARNLDTPVFLNLGNVKSIGFICSAESIDDLDQVNQITEEIAKTGIPYKGLLVEGVTLFKDEPLREEFAQQCSNGNIVFVPRNQFNWLGELAWQENADAGAEINDFFASHFNLFINLNKNSNFSVDYLTLRANADFIVGMHNNPKMPFSLILDCGNEEFSYSRYLLGLFDFLGKVNL